MQMYCKLDYHIGKLLGPRGNLKVKADGRGFCSDVYSDRIVLCSLAFPIPNGVVYVVLGGEGDKRWMHRHKKLGGCKESQDHHEDLCE